MEVLRNVLAFSPLDDSILSRQIEVVVPRYGNNIAIQFRDKMEEPSKIIVTVSSPKKA